MKKILLSISLICIVSLATNAQTVYSQDTESIDNIIAALYEVISGEANEARDWDRFTNLFAKDAKLIPTTKNAAGEISYRYWTPADYVEMFTSSRRTTGFFEEELARKTETYGSIVHVFTTYATRATKDGPTTNRGINSIQLLKGKDRYYIMNIFWSAESDGYPLPDIYLKD